MNEPIQSVIQARRNGPLIAAAAALWIGSGDLVLDVTYGRGLFWTDYQPPRLVKHDIALDGVDFRHLPEPDGSMDVVVFDPPYIAQGTKTGKKESFTDRYGLEPRTVPEVQQLMSEGMTEAVRVLRRGGRLFVKCADYVKGGRYIQGRHFVVSTAMGLGLEQVDEFVHHSGLGPQPRGRRQVHSRRAHSILCIFQK